MVQATLRFFSYPLDGSRPTYKTYVDAEQATNYPYNHVNVEIQDLRGQNRNTTLDENGFRFIERPTKHKEFINEEDIKREYYPDVEQLLKDETGASRVLLFDYTLRRRRPGEVDDGPEKRQPVSLVHVDQTNAAAIARVHLHLPEEAPELLKKRFQIINVWRPIAKPAYDWPLALCDYATMDQGDLVPVALLYPDREGETFGVKHGDGQKWNYMRGMTPDEAVLIKCFDSKEGVACFTPHTAFEDPSTPKDTPLRESIEVRALLFYD